VIAAALIESRRRTELAAEQKKIYVQIQTGERHHEPEVPKFPAAAVCAISFCSFARLSLEQLIHKLLAVAEIGPLDKLECVSQVKETAARIQVEHPKRTDYAKSFAARDPHPLAVIHDQQIGCKRFRQCERGSFSIVEALQ